MSADLFAEFNSLSNNSTPSPGQQQQQQNAPFKSPVQQQTLPPKPLQRTGTQDLFGLLGNTNNVSPVNTQPLADFKSQSSSQNAWGSVPIPSKPAKTNDDDDDGWGDFEVAEPSQPATNNATPIQNSSPAPFSISGWGSAASATPNSANSSVIPWPKSDPSPAAAVAQQAPGIKQQPPTRVVRASTMDLLSNSLVDIQAASQKPTSVPKTQPPGSKTQLTQEWGQPTVDQESQQRMKAKLKLSAKQDPSVLFDAEDFELQVADGEEDDDDDEFGDFESVPPPPSVPKTTCPVAATKPTPAPPSMDLLPLEEPVPAPTQPQTQKPPPTKLLGPLAFGATTTNYPQAPKSPSFQDRNPFPELAIKTPTSSEPKEIKKPREETPTTAWPSFESPKDIKLAKTKEQNDEWGAWDDFSATDNRKAVVSTKRAPESWEWDAVGNVQPSQNESQDNTPPPINIPPPSVILSAFPDLLNAGTALFKPVSGQSASIKQRILSDPKAVDFLQGYILLATTAARVIAGRKQRWHRDKILAKSMSISAAGSKGMKLAGVDKTQAAREDREAADVVAVWRQQVGRLRSAVAAAKSADKSLSLQVPEISENMQVQAAKMVPTAPKACIICGLKREERVAKVDYKVEDSFGEWWLDHWGHRACKNFWTKHEQKLRQR
ncbi:hypothetical protein F53441_12523 [Fusarium austroafricanum]|uniref:Serine/threonine-protein kinase ppk6 n=1 Tax=Fusarium austroafricanum TaxID=2364996 RepID=A0A8H4NVM4_9HYPO|nr:hypothetical protein F53441_12523 [Fusarium austroafricanum]